MWSCVCLCPVFTTRLFRANLCESQTGLYRGCEFTGNRSVCVRGCVCVPRGPLLFPVSLYERRGSERERERSRCGSGDLFGGVEARLDLKEGLTPPPFLSSSQVDTHTRRHAHSPQRTPPSARMDMLCARAMRRQRARAHNPTHAHARLSLLYLSGSAD